MENVSFSREDDGQPSAEQTAEKIWQKRNAKHMRHIPQIIRLHSPEWLLRLLSKKVFVPVENLACSNDLFVAYLILLSTQVHRLWAAAGIFALVIMYFLPFVSNFVTLFYAYGCMTITPMEQMINPMGYALAKLTDLYPLTGFPGWVLILTKLGRCKNKSLCASD
eukprot:Selendium_serpulae@DN3890_c0_g1_i2.p1